MGKWLKNGKSIDLEEMTDLVYRFSREVEHSDENLKRVETMMEKKCFLQVSKETSVQDKLIKLQKC